MHFAHLTATLAAISAVAALQNPHSKVSKKAKRVPSVQHETKHANYKRQSSYLTSKTAKFAVNGSAIPEVDFDIGESYAGTLSIDSNSTSADALWFWFFPSEPFLVAERYLQPNQKPLQLGQSHEHGFSPAKNGTPQSIKNEHDVAVDFAGFWKNL
ncbi:hypothetical protein LTR17_000939 [Elasticomyces elasticus]|nr:hypothetical protein LTR17_000939 [Elasticomyces elasticus]